MTVDASWTDSRNPMSERGHARGHAVDKGWSGLPWTFGGGVISPAMSHDLAFEGVK